MLCFDAWPWRPNELFQPVAYPRAFCADFSSLIPPSLGILNIGSPTLAGPHDKPSGDCHEPFPAYPAYIHERFCKKTNEGRTRQGARSRLGAARSLAAVAPETVDVGQPGSGPGFHHDDAAQEVGRQLGNFSRLHGRSEEARTLDGHGQAGSRDLVDAALPVPAPVDKRIPELKAPAATCLPAARCNQLAPSLGEAPYFGPPGARGGGVMEIRLRLRQPAAWRSRHQRERRARSGHRPSAAPRDCRGCRARPGSGVAIVPGRPCQSR